MLERDETNWEKLRKWLILYKEMKGRDLEPKYDDPKCNYFRTVQGGYGRYCIALSIDEILEKMDEIEGKIKKS
jgi:hypothetical protein